MKYVIQTQYRENYGAHDWDGEGECPQYWKFKGGDTYIFDVSLEQAQDPAFYEQIESAVTTKSYAQEEYIIGSQLIDDIDYVESDHVEPWETPTYYMPLADGGFEGLRITENDEYGYMRSEIKKRYESWIQVDGEQTQFNSEFELTDGTKCLYKDLGKYLGEAA